MLITCTIAYITSTFMIEAISVANSEDLNRRHGSMFGDTAYKSPIIQRKANLADLDDKASPFYIRQKIEIGIVAEKVATPFIKKFIIVIMTIYMYGAICLKYVSGAESFDSGIAFTFWDSEEGFENWLGFDPYYIGILIFGSLSIYFSFGNIENAKTLQIVTTILRFIVTILMCIGSIYYIESAGINEAPVFDLKNQIKCLA